jgi:mannose-6-phosphate isomerase-like protein (cupin superfamily)
MEAINLRARLALIDTPWSPRIVGELNGQHVKLARLEGAFVWHRHATEDELFLVLRGTLEMQFRDRSVTVREGELIIVPRGVEHCPRAGDEVDVLLFEPASTLNTGDADDPRRVDDPPWL